MAGERPDVEQDLRRLRALREAQRREYAELRDWKRQKEDIKARLKPARDNARRNHEAVMAIAKKRDEKKAEAALMARASSSAKGRRKKNRPPVDEYGEYVNDWDRVMVSYEESEAVRKLERKIANLELMYNSYVSEDQEAERE
jgi:hypothetical protein